MVKRFAVIFGLVFLVVGILGFVPVAAPDGILLNTFHVNTAHNMVHVASGIIFLFAVSNLQRHLRHHRYLGLRR
jgi:heme/copper-type cytochrome/quinol oxidase subunit 3